MRIYGIWLLAAAGLYSLLWRLPLKGKGFWYPLIISLMLTAILGLRHPGMGVDLGYGKPYGYLPSFQILKELPWKTLLTMEPFQNYERGFVLFNKLVGMLCGKEQWFLFCCAAASILPIGAVIGAFSRNQRLSFLIYFGLTAFQIPFSGLRQAIAAAVAFAAFFAVRKQSPMAFLALVILASSFHDTALTVLAVYPLYRCRTDKRGRVISLGLLAIIFALRVPLWNSLVTLLNRGHPALHSGDVGLLLLFCGIYGYMILFAPETEEISGLVNLQWLCCCVLCFTEVSTVAARVAYYSMLYLTLSLPEILQHIRTRFGEREYALHTLAVAAGFVLLGFYNLLHADWAAAVPYAFFWEGL